VARTHRISHPEECLLATIKSKLNFTKRKHSVPRRPSSISSCLRTDTVATTIRTIWYRKAERHRESSRRREVQRVFPWEWRRLRLPKHQVRPRPLPYPQRLSGVVLWPLSHFATYACVCIPDSGQARHRAGSREFLNDLLQFTPVRYEQGIVRGIDNGISRWRSQDPILWKQHCRWTRIVQRLCVGSQHERGPGHDRTSHLTGARPSWRQNVLDSGITWIHTLSKLVLEQRIVKVKRSRSVSVDLRCNRVQRTIASCV